MHSCRADSPGLEAATALIPVVTHKGTTWSIRERLRVFGKTAIRVSPTSKRHPIALSNDIAVFGDQDVSCSRAGTELFWPNSSVSLAAGVADGTATTLMLGEREGSRHV